MVLASVREFVEREVIPREDEAGSDPSGMRTRARRDGNEYVINGSNHDQQRRPR